MTPAQQGDVRVARWMIWLNALVPGVLLAWDAAHGHAGANPVNFAIHTTGEVSLIFLLLSLAMTPAARITGWNWLITFRRVFGLYGFFYAVAHFAIFFWWDRQRSVSSTIHEIITRKYIWFGMTALVLLIPLAATSFDAAIRAMGPKNWKRLHRLSYVVAIAVCVHFYMQVKKDISTPLTFAAVLAVLLEFRVVWAILKRVQMVRRKRLAAERAMGRPKFWTGELVVRHVRPETHEVRTIELASPDGGPLPFQHLPGQYLNLVLQIDGQPVRRSYTIASSPTQTDHCELTVKREEMGLSSKHLHERIRAGDRLAVSAPAGRFTFLGGDEPGVVLIGGGVGITPLMSKLRYLIDKRWSGQIYLIFSVRGRRDVIFHEELERLQREHSNLHVTITLTRDEDGTWTGPRGRVTRELIADAVPNLRKYPVHLCGPDAMIPPLVETLLALGVARDRIAFESFTSPKAAAMPRTITDSALPAGEPVDTTVTFTQSGETAEVAAGQTILDAAESIGVDVPYDCRTGICGTCKVRLNSGRVTMDVQDALTDADRAGGLILLCQARCLEAVEVEA